MATTPPAKGKAFTNHSGWGVRAGSFRIQRELKKLGNRHPLVGAMAYKREEVRAVKLHEKSDFLISAAK